MNNLDPAEIFMGMLGGGETNDRVGMALLADKQLDILLKYMQLLWYADQLEDEKLIDQMTHRVRPMIELVCDNIDEEVRKYQEKHGEI